MVVSTDGLVDDWFRSATAASATGQLVGSVDWAATPLGPPASWSVGLRTAVGICLTSRFPMLVTWGDDLVMIYNDGYREMIGGKHPGALGAAARDVFPEIWPIVGPMFDEVMAGRGATWQEDHRLALERNGFVEECYFTYSFSPIVDDDGQIGGVIDVVTETTDRVIGTRRLACLGELAGELVGAADVTDVSATAVKVLAACADDVPVVEFHFVVGDHVVLLSSNRREGIVGSIGVDLLGAVVAEWRPRLVDVGRAGPHRFYLVPVGDRGEPAAAGVLVCGLNPQRPWDGSYRSFIEHAGNSVGTSLIGASRHAVELGEQRHISKSLQDAMMSPTDHVPGVVVRYLPAVGNLAVGGDWYDAIELDNGRLALLVGDCVGHGLGAATVMGQLRSASRALLLDGCGPATMLEGLDRFAATIDGALCTTVCCIVVDPVDGSLTYALAGHPPPIVERDGEVVVLDDGRGRPLAVGTPGERRETTVAVTAADTVVVYTDGLIERRDEPLTDGLARLATAMAGTGGLTLEEVADHLMRTMLPADTFDDVALAVHRPLVNG